MRLLLKFTPYFFIFWIGRAFYKAIKFMFLQEGFLRQLMQCKSIQALGLVLSLLLIFKVLQLTTRAFMMYKIEKMTNTSD